MESFLFFLIVGFYTLVKGFHHLLPNGKKKLGFCNQLLQLFLSKATSVLVACNKK